jgi:hypothetical protein
VLAARQDYAIALPAADEGADGVPAPGTRGAVGKLRLRFARVLLEGAPPAGDGHGNGHGNGHAAIGDGEPERAAVTAGDGPDHPADGPSADSE